MLDWNTLYIYIYYGFKYAICLSYAWGFRRNIGVFVFSYAKPRSSADRHHHFEVTSWVNLQGTGDRRLFFWNVLYCTAYRNTWRHMHKAVILKYFAIRAEMYVCMYVCLYVWRSQWPRGLRRGVRPLAFWDCRFESRWGMTVCLL
jgi:hypothetical protein